MSVVWLAHDECTQIYTNLYLEIMCFEKFGAGVSRLFCETIF